MKRFSHRILGILFLTALTSCNKSLPPRSFEMFLFDYKFATRVNPNSYELKVGGDADCQNQRADRFRLDQFADVLQIRGTAYDQFKKCAGHFVVNMPQAEANGLTNKLRVRQGTDPSNNQVDITATATGFAGVSPSPTSIVIQPDGPVSENQKTTGGFAEIYFGTTGPVFRCQSSSGDNPWSAHAQNGDVRTFFEFELTTLAADHKSGAGNFQCIARNTTDPSDTRVLLIIDGLFGMTVH